MGLEPMAGAPAGAKTVAAQRMGPGPMVDGNATTQSVVTALRNGVLVDCISQTKRDKAEFDYAFNNFEKVCAFSKP
jgi:hypothetical protein